MYLRPWTPSQSESLRRQYELLAEHLRGTDARNFEQLGKQSDLTEGTGTEAREPNLDEQISQVLREAELKAAAKEAEAENEESSPPEEPAKARQ